MRFPPMSESSSATVSLAFFSAVVPVMVAIWDYDSK
jgi:hypothetical protein